jgi:hypothetical protein
MKYFLKEKTMIKLSTSLLLLGLLNFVQCQANTLPKPSGEYLTGVAYFNFVDESRKDKFGPRLACLIQGKQVPYLDFFSWMGRALFTKYDIDGRTGEPRLYRFQHRPSL